jgi:putative nucleotidyltransferase with HDIG domain
MKRSGIATSIVISLLAVTGAGALFFSLRTLPAWVSWGHLPVVVLAILLQLLDVDLFTYHQNQPDAPAARERRALTAGFAGTFLVLGVYGVEAAVVTALCQAVVTAVVHRGVWFKMLFNTGLYMTATFLAGWAYQVLGGHAPAWNLSAVVATLVAAGVSIGVQSVGVAVVISLSTGRAFRPLWLDSLGWVVLQQAVVGLIGLLLGRFMNMGMTLLGVLLLLSPLALLRYSYWSFAGRIAAYVGQIERANTDLAHLNTELRTTNDELIATLGSVLDARDRYTYGHSAQVARYSVALGEKLGLSPQDQERLRKAALLHDIGKVGIPEAILFKAGPLDAQERRIMQAHAEIGYRITRNIHSLADVAEIIRQHHEWYGGGGYPQKLAGEEILLSARIIGVADALDTLVSDRPYRKGKPVEVAFQEIRRCTGTQFDPGVVAALELLVRERGGLWFTNSASGVGHGALAMEVAAAAAE